MADFSALDRYVIVSADGHAGAQLYEYRDYLPSKWHEEFDAWAASYVDPWASIDPGINGTKFGAASGTYEGNWDHDLRQKQVEGDGIVGEVLFPNTVPPFMSELLGGINPQSREEYERLVAGTRAHNRWLVDFCSRLPGRRAGIAQVLFYDVDDALAEIRWAKEAGLTGGVLLPAVPPNSGVPELSSPENDPIWALCEDLGMVLNHHQGTGAPNLGNAQGAACINMFEAKWFAARTMTHLILGGVFHRHPGLKYVITEAGTGWVPAQLAQMDYRYHRMTTPGTPESMFAKNPSLSMTPLEYFANNCYIGASFITRAEVQVRHDIGIDRIMWGLDYPHSDGTYPYTREGLRYTMAGVPTEEIRMMLGETAADLYGFDTKALIKAAETVGPTVAEIAEPIHELPTSTVSLAFDPVDISRPW